MPVTNELCRVLGRRASGAPGMTHRLAGTVSEWEEFPEFSSYSETPKIFLQQGLLSPAWSLEVERAEKKRTRRRREGSFSTCRACHPDGRCSRSPAVGLGEGPNPCRDHRQLGWSRVRRKALMWESSPKVEGSGGRKAGVWCVRLSVACVCVWYLYCLVYMVCVCMCVVSVLCLIYMVSMVYMVCVWCLYHVWCTSCVCGVCMVSGVHGVCAVSVLCLVYMVCVVSIVSDIHGVYGVHGVRAVSVSCLVYMCV